MPSVFAAEGALPGPYTGTLQMITALAIVVAAIGGIAWLLRRFANPITSSPGILKVVTTQSMGPRERLVVVEVGDCWLVLGVTGQAINALHTMPKQDIPGGQGNQSGFDFRNILSVTLRQNAKR